MVLEESGLRQRTASMSNAALVARQEAANQVRHCIDGTPEHHGVKGIGGLRRSEASIAALRGAADLLTRRRRGEIGVALSGASSAGRRLAPHAARTGNANLAARIDLPLRVALVADVR